MNPSLWGVRMGVARRPIPGPYELCGENEDQEVYRRRGSRVLEIRRLGSLALLVGLELRGALGEHVVGQEDGCRSVSCLDRGFLRPRPRHRPGTGPESRGPGIEDGQGRRRCCHRPFVGWDRSGPGSVTCFGLQVALDGLEGHIAVHAQWLLPSKGSGPASLSELVEAPCSTDEGTRPGSASVQTNREVLDVCSYHGEQPYQPNRHESATAPNCESVPTSLDMPGSLGSICPDQRFLIRAVRAGSALRPSGPWGQLIAGAIDVAEQAGAVRWREAYHQRYSEPVKGPKVLKYPFCNSSMNLRDFRA